jgi:tripartite-type tricarboxylate transporter receptor subunit TctC
MTTNTNHVANEHLYKKLPCAPVKDLTPVMVRFKGQMVLVVKPPSSANSVGDLIALAHRTPDTLQLTRRVRSR